MSKTHSLLAQNDLWKQIPVCCVPYFHTQAILIQVCQQKGAFLPGSAQAIRDRSLHILRNYEGGGRGFPNDYTSVIFTQQTCVIVIAGKNIKSLVKEFSKILIFESFGYLKIGFDVTFDAYFKSPRMTQGMVKMQS